MAERSPEGVRFVFHGRLQQEQGIKKQCTAVHCFFVGAEEICAPVPVCKAGPRIGSDVRKRPARLTHPPPQNQFRPKKALIWPSRMKTMIGGTI